MAGFIENLRNLYQEQLERHRNRPFLEASMAACALVAMADGSVDLRERVRVDQVLETLKELQTFDPHEGVDLFNAFVGEIVLNPREGRDKALAVLLDEVQRDREKAELLIRIAVAVSKVQGEIPVPEQIEIVRLCSELKVEPRDAGLYAVDGGPDITAPKAE